MTGRPANPLLNGRSRLLNRPDAGSDLALMHLEDHCARLNASPIGWKWALTGEPPHRTITRIY